MIRLPQLSTTFTDSRASFGAAGAGLAAYQSVTFTAFTDLSPGAQTSGKEMPVCRKLEA